MKISELMVKLNQVTQKNIGKVIYSLFLMMILESVFTLFFSGPSMLILSKEEVGLQAKALAFFLLYLAALIWLLFQFGFAIMLLRMVRDEHVTLGYMFLGFKKIKVCLKYIVAFSGILVVAAVIARFITKYVSVNFIESVYEEGSATLIQFVMFASIFFLISFVASIHFAFVFHLHFDNPSKPIKNIFTKSAGMMRGNVFRLIGFALKAGGKQLLIALLIALVLNFIPEGAKKSASILIFLLDLVYIINLYTALAKIYFTVPVLYTKLLEAKNESSTPALVDISIGDKEEDGQNADS